MRLECLVKTAVVSVTEHSGDFLNGQIRSFHQDHGSVHSFFKYDFGLCLAELLVQK